MVYALNVKPEHGYYVEVEALDGDIRAISLIDDSPDEGWHPRNIPTSAGRRVHTDNFPKRMKWLDRNRHPIPDFDDGLMLNVSGRVQAILEKLDPGAHQFVPVEYVDKDGEQFDQRYFLIIGNRLDSVDRKRTTMVLRDDRIWTPVADLVRDGDPVPAGIDPLAKPLLVFNDEQIGDANLWIEKHLTGGSRFLSDRLHEAFAEAGITGIRPSKEASV